MLNTELSLSILIGGLSSLLFCLALVWSKRWHGAFTFDHTEGVQKFHAEPTPRIGGAAIYAGIWSTYNFAPTQTQNLMWPLLIAGLPALAFGLIEDVTRKVGVMPRLLATIFSGFLIWWLADVRLSHAGLPLLDDLLLVVPVSVILSAVLIGGVANAVNIIDGFNGLSSGTLVISSLALGWIAYQVGDVALAQVLFILSSVMLGFFLVNYPFGKIFLGDGGAYFAGFALSCLAIMLPMRNNSVEPLACLLACAYPIIEVLFSIYRRWKRAHHPGHPDRLHLHSVIRSRVVGIQWPQISGLAKNSLVSPFLWSYVLLGALGAVALYESLAGLLIFIVLYVLIYTLLYDRIIHFKLNLKSNSV